MILSLFLLRNSLCYRKDIAIFRNYSLWIFRPNMKPQSMFLGKIENWDLKFRMLKNAPATFGMGMKRIF